MFRTIWLVCALLLVSWQAVYAQERRLDTLIPQKIQPLLSHAQKIINTAFVGYKDRGTIEHPNQEFADTLRQIGARLDMNTVQQIAALEGSDVRATLVAIAWDRRQRPQVYREIEQEYVWFVVNPGGRALASHELEDKHATEAYRLPWEYLLLSPPFPSPVGGYDERAREALLRLRNDAAVAAIVCAFGTTTVEGTDPESGHDGGQYIRTLSLFDNAAGLRGILQCLSLAEDRRRRHPPQEGEEYKTLKYIFNYLQNDTRPEHAALWRGVIAAYPRQGLTAMQKSLLDSIAPTPKSSPQ